MKKKKEEEKNSETNRFSKWRVVRLLLLLFSFFLALFFPYLFVFDYFNFFFF